jgi:hypothetical protein
MSPTKSTAVATGISNGRTLLIVYEMGCESSVGALTKSPVTFDDRSGISEMYSALKDSVMPSSSVRSYRNVLPLSIITIFEQKGAYHRMNNNAAWGTNVSFNLESTKPIQTYYAFSLRASAIYTLMLSSAI